MTGTTRIPRADRSGPRAALLRWFARRLLGTVPEPLEVMGHNWPVLSAFTGFGRRAARWDRLDADLKAFAHLATSAAVGCSWCLDFGYFHAHNGGVDEAKASQAPRWRSSPVFTPLERDVMEYAEAMTATPACVDDDLAARLLDRLGPGALVELTGWVAFANLTARANSALGIRSQELSAVCQVPLAPSPAGPVPTA